MDSNGQVARPAPDVGPPAAGLSWQGQPLTGLCRVTVAFGGRSVDLTLPSDIPVAAFLGELAWTCGVRLDSEQPPPLYLSRPVSGMVPPSRTLAQAGVVDGDVLVLSERPIEAPRVVDDLGRAITEAVERKPGQWGPATSVAALCTALVLASLAGALALALGWERLAAPWPLLPAAVTIGMLGLALFVRGPAPADPIAGSAAPGLAASGGFAPGGVASGGAAPGTAAPGAAGASTAGRIRLALLLAAVPWGALAGMTLFGAIRSGPTSSPALAAAGAGVVVTALLGAAISRDGAPVLLAIALAGGAVAGAAGGVAAGLSAEQAGSVLAVLAIVCLLLLPWVVVRASGLAGLDDGSLSEEVTGRVAGARRLLAWLAAGVSAASLVAAVLLATAPGPAGRALALICAVAVGLRARSFRFIGEVAGPLTAAIGGAAAVGGAVALEAGGPLALAIAALVVALALAGVAVPAGSGRELSPGVGKAVELLELGCLLAVVPVAAISSGALTALSTFAAGIVGGS